jgi:hypothetical protein
MDTPENDLSNAARPMDNVDAIESLRRQVNLLLGGLIITSFTVTAFLGLQARRASADLMALAQPAQETARVSQQEGQSMQAFVLQLEEFARSHPDFQKQVLAHYRFNTNPPAAPAKK